MTQQASGMPVIFWPWSPMNTRNATSTRGGSAERAQRRRSWRSRRMGLRASRRTAMADRNIMISALPEPCSRSVPARGDRARPRVRDLLAPTAVQLDESWGLDHGTGRCWRMLPDRHTGGQLSMDGTSGALSLRTRQQLAPAREASDSSAAATWAQLC